MRVACVLITHLRAKIEAKRRLGLKDRPVVIVDRGAAQAAPVVVDCGPAARGVVTGMTLEEAAARCPGIVVLETDEPRYRRVFTQVLRSLQRVSDRVEDAGLGAAYVRMDGLEDLYRGEAGTVSALLNAVPSYLTPRIGVADAKFPAFVAALASEAHGASRVPDDVSRFLAPHPVDLLPVPLAVKMELRRLGLRAMGDVAAMGERMITDRFGPEGRRAWELCTGADVSPVVAMPFRKSVIEHASLPFHSSSLEALFVMMDILLRRAYSQPEMRNKCASSASLRCEAPGWPAWEASVSFKEPAGTWERASAGVRSRLESDPPHIPVEEVTLTLSGLAGESGTQMGLLEDVHDDRRRKLVEVDRKLQPLMGGGPALHRITEVAPWHPAPEMRALRVPVDPSGGGAVGALHTPKPAEVREGAGREPESVRIRGRWRQVSRIDDRWTFDLWWLHEPVAREYYRVDSDDGGKITLFRDIVDDRWYRQSA